MKKKTVSTLISKTDIILGLIDSLLFEEMHSSKIEQPCSSEDYSKLYNAREFMREYMILKGGVVNYELDTSS